ncbi:hypothetical protein D7V86_14725 [bacterium D16-51]|nr:hypothetical protein D7V96_18975 [bacterium D16-59]RKI58949.1 hypothetical protein D7V86_14725 [bacterium D16-51]
MIYDEFRAGINEYSALWAKGLKKQANKVLATFAENFRNNVPQENSDEILYQFCCDFYDENGYSELREHGGLDLPYSLMGLVYEFLKRACLANKMPQMRWAYQLGGRYYYPFDRNLEQDPYDVLKRAYEHPECDEKTVRLYLENLLYDLDFGAHHFPEGCCIAREQYLEDVTTAEKILREHNLPLEFTKDLEYYKTLYRVYFEWSDSGRNGDFDELLRVAGISFTAPRAFYYTILPRK